MKFGWIINYNRNIFWKNRTQTYSIIYLFPDPFLKKNRIEECLDQHSEVLHNFLLLYVQIEEYQSILKLRSGSLALLHIGQSIQETFKAVFHKFYLV